MVEQSSKPEKNISHNIYAGAIAHIMRTRRIFRPEPPNTKKFPTVNTAAAIPRVIYQTWPTELLPAGLSAAVSALKAANPTFEHRLYSDVAAREMIRDHFPEHILHAYDSLRPGAYRADLWRYCVLYLYGGVYLDAKYQPVDGFSFDSLLDREHFCRDRQLPWMDSRVAIYNAFMIVRAGNDSLARCIKLICEHTQNQSYGKTYLDPTGPLLLGRFVSEEQCTCTFDNPGEKQAMITMSGKLILTDYPTYRDEQRASFKALGTKYYVDLWRTKQVYLRNLPPDTLIQTIYTIPNEAFTTAINFNSCMVRDGKGELRAFYRVRDTIPFNWDNNHTYTCLVDTDTMLPRRETVKRLPLVLGDMKYKCTEDTRAVSWHSHFYLTYTDGRSSFVGKCTETGDLLYSHRLDKPEGVRFGDLEKNWMPFVHNDQLCILYAANPNIIFVCTDTGERLEISETVRIEQPPVACLYGEIRGGCAPVVYDEGHLLWFFHTVHDGWYKTGAMLTDAAHRIVALTDLPVAVGNPVLFPCGAFIHKDGWRVTAGVENRFVGYFDVPRWLLEKHWVRYK